MQVQLPPKLYSVYFNPDGSWRRSRYKDVHGGRGSAKSHTKAQILAARGASEKLRVLCTREMQNSIADSVHKLLKDSIYRLRLHPYYHITENKITSRAGTEFIFKGLHRNISEIKSLEGIDICWAEEAERISEESWRILIPTIRKENSEIWASWNPDLEESATYRRFVLQPPPDCISVEMNYMDNPWFPEVLRREMEYDKATDFEKYEHIWLGKLKAYADALVLRGKFRVEEFETPADARFFYGSDFGYSSAPTCIVRCFIQGRKLYVDYDAGGVGIEINETPALYDSIPGSRQWEITADSARPETISYLRQQGFNIVGAEKGKGSVEDGIQFLRAFEEIILHPRCKGTLRDCQNYKWKVDRITGDILPIPVDASNDYIDAIRYALEKYIKRKVTIWDL